MKQAAHVFHDGAPSKLTPPHSQLARPRAHNSVNLFGRILLFVITIELNKICQSRDYKSQCLKRRRSIKFHPSKSEMGRKGYVISKGYGHK